MGTVQIQVDRFTTIRKTIPDKVARSIPSRLVMPEYLEDRNRGAPQVDPITHKLHDNQASRVIEEDTHPTEIDSIIPKGAIPVEDVERPVRGSLNVSSAHGARKKMYKCKYCGSKSEDRGLVKRHAKLCKRMHE